MLKVSPWKWVVHFGKRGKLNPRYVGPFKVLAKVGAVAYKLELPQELSRVQSTFHEPVEIMYREVNRYASILFDIGADRSFVSTAFSSLIDITPTTLDHYYDVELADGKIIRITTIIRGCTLNFLNHSFNIDLMPVELGSFDVIIGMDWLAKYHAVIICDEKLVRIPFGNETFIVRGDRSNQGNETRLNIISCTKIQKYMLKGCHIFLAHVTTKKTDNNSKEKRLEDVPIVQDFPEVFPKDLSGFSGTRQVISIDS
ncbi:putative reverse transcriptase domain-containing protein [Tanacetum coccineum]